MLRPLTMVLASVLLLPLGFSRATASVSPRQSGDTLLSAEVMAETWGGVMGGRIGNKNAGILELKCGDSDILLTNTQKAPYERLGTNYYGPCVVSQELHNIGFADLPSSVVPTYDSFQGHLPQFAINAAITQNQSTGRPAPFVQVFLNQNPTPIATIPCVKAHPWRTGKAFQNDTYDSPAVAFVESFSCPGATGTGFFVQDIPLNQVLKGDLNEEPLNILSARTQPGDGQFDEYAFQDQEVRFFKVTDY